MIDLFVITQKRYGIVTKLQNNELIELGRIKVPYNSKTVITENNVLFNLFVKEKELRIFDSKLHIIKELKDFHYDSIAVKQNIVYLGGSYGGDPSLQKGELFSLIDATDPDFNLNNISIPIETKFGKRIDDILIHDDDLYLVDNIVYPNYLIHYNCVTPENPIHIATHQLPIHGTYEVIEKGYISSQWMVLISSTGGEWGCATHVISYKRPFEMSDPAKYSQLLRDFYNNESHLLGNALNSGESVHDICLIDDILYLVKDKRLGYFSLNDDIDHSNFQIIETKIKKVDKLVKTPTNRIIAVNKRKYELIDPLAH